MPNFLSLFTFLTLSALFFLQRPKCWSADIVSAFTLQLCMFLFRSLVQPLSYDGCKNHV